MGKGRLVFLFAVFLILGTLVKATDITECQNITSPGTYTLTANITGEHPLMETSAYYSCINIDADNVVLNCQNHAIYQVYNDSLGATATAITVIRNTPTDTNILIENCVVSGIGGIYMENASFNTLNNIMAVDSWGDMGMGIWAGTGITLEYSNSNILTDIIACGNNATYSTSGIDIRDSTNNTVTNALLCNNQPIGLFLLNATSSAFTNINATNSTFDGCDGSAYYNYALCGDGIAVAASSSNNFTDIIAYGNTVAGVGLYDSDNNTFSGLISADNYDGIDFYGSASNTIDNSQIYNNSNNGIYLDSSYSPTQNNLLHNNYFNNTINILFQGDVYNNSWNTTQGNYWVNYSMNCTNANGDAFCDVSYDVLNDVGCVGNCSNNTDYLPLAYSSCGSRGLNITTWDELTNQQIYFNAYITNGTASMSVSDVWQFNETDCNASLPTGNVTVAVSNVSYYSPRYLYADVGLVIMKFYLLPLNDSNAVLATFIVQDAGTSPTVGIPNAMVEVYKDFGGWPVLMAARYTDGIGAMSLYVDSKTQYIANASAAGYYPKSVSASFSNSSVIYIYLNRLAYGFGFPNPYSDVNYTLLPANHDLYADGTNTTFILTISSKNGTLTNYGMNITNSSGSLLSSGSGSAAYGSSISSSINTSLNSDYLNVSVWFISPTYAPTPFTQIIKYVIYPPTNGSMQQILGPGGLIANSGMSGFAMGLLALIISLAVSGAFSTVGFSIGKNGIIFTICMTAFAGLGFLTSGLWLELIMIQVGFIVIRWM